MLNLNQNMGIGSVVSLLGLKEICRRVTPSGGEVRMFYEGEKVVADHYDEYDEYLGRDVFDTYEQATEEIARRYF